MSVGKHERRTGPRPIRAREINTRGAAKSAMLGVDIQQPPKAGASSTLDLDADLSVHNRNTPAIFRTVSVKERTGLVELNAQRNTMWNKMR